MKLHPIDDCVRKAISYMERGHRAYQQFLCAHCGAKQTMTTPNVFFESGTCEECGKVTDIKKDGCNWMLHALI